MNEIDMSYTKWIWHRKKSQSEYDFHKRAHMEDVSTDLEDDHLVDMINDNEECYINYLEEFVKLLEDAESPLFRNSKFTKLSFLVRIFNTKARNS